MERRGIPKMELDVPISEISPILHPFLNPLRLVIRHEISTFVPSAFKMYYIVQIMDKLISHDIHFTHNQRGWHPFISRIYFGVIFIIQTTRAEIAARVASYETKKFYDKFSYYYPPETLPIPGPLAAMFGSLVGSKCVDPPFDSVCPKLPEIIGPARARDLINYDVDHANQLIQPNIPCLIGLMNSIIAASADAIPNYSDPDTFDDTAERVLNGHIFYQANWTNEERGCLLTPGMLYLADTNKNIDKNCHLYASRIGLPQIDGDTDISTRDKFTFLDGDMTWFGNVIHIMRNYCEYFTGSCSLSECKFESSFSALITTEYVEVNTEYPIENLTKAFPNNGPFLLDAKHYTTERTVPPLEAMLAQSASLNVKISLPLSPWNVIGTNTRTEPYWTNSPVHLGSRVENTYRYLSNIVSKQYKLERDSD